MKLLAEYLEHARQFELLADGSKDDPRLRRMMLRQAVAYRMLALKRANMPKPPVTALERRTARGAQ